jgi:lipopolysaccharide export system protein LptA
LIGNVRFSQEGVRVSCDRALQYLNRGDLVLTGNVVVRDDSVTMKGPRGAYHRDERRAEAFDDVHLDDGKVQLVARYGEYFVEPKRAFFRSNVVVRDSASTVTADSLTYWRADKRSQAEGNVRIFSSSDHVTIAGKFLEHYSIQQFSRMSRQPMLVQYDTSLTGIIDTLVVRSRVMESYSDSLRRLVAIDSVEIVRSDLAAVGGRAQFYPRGDSIHLRVNPLVWYRTTQLSGDSIDVFLRERKLHVLSVKGDAFAVSQGDSLRPERLDQLSGETMRMTFEDQLLRRIDVDVRATSVYYLYDSTAANGLNRSSGDRIALWFDKGRAQSIRVFGGVEGSYVPQNIVQGHESDYALRRILWRDNRPRIKAAELKDKNVGMSNAPF